MEETVRTIADRDAEILTLASLEDKLRRALKRETPGTKDYDTLHAMLAETSRRLDSLDTEIEDMRRRAVVEEILRKKRAAYKPFDAVRPLVNFSHIS
jgi:tRNA C32,U32 (ribose-2'-O)-methylase TrmJ